MVNAALIQAKLNYGYGKTAAALGNTFSFYRSANQSSLLLPDGERLLLPDGLSGLALPPTPTEAPNPLAVAPYASLPVSLNAEDPTYRRPNKYGKATWWAYFDATDALVGDYLVGKDGTFFIAALQTLLTPLVVECNRILTISTPQNQVEGGLQGYGGNTAANEVKIMDSWPASVLQGTKGEKTDARLPGDTRDPWWAILMPSYPGVRIQFGDVATDEAGQRMIISSAELTGLGWRLTAQEAAS